MYSETRQKRWNSTAARRKRECLALSGGALNVRRFDTFARLCYVNALFRGWTPIGGQKGTARITSIEHQNGGRGFDQEQLR